MPGESVYSDRECQSEQIRPTAASRKNKTGKKTKKTAGLWENTEMGRTYSRELPGLRSQGKLKCTAPLMREQLRKRMIYVRNISDTHIHKTGYWNQRHQRATCRYPEMKGKASRRIFQPLQLLIHSFCSPLCQPSVMSACVHWGLQLAHQTHSSRESTLPLQSPFLAFRSPGSSKETGNL